MLLPSFISKGTQAFEGKMSTTISLNSGLVAAPVNNGRVQPAMKIRLVLQGRFIRRYGVASILVAAICWIAVFAVAPALAVSGGAAVAANTFQYVGVVNDLASPDALGSGYGTGSYIRPGVVLTAAHVGNFIRTTSGGADTGYYIDPTFQRFQFGGTGTSYAGLAIDEPTWTTGTAGNYNSSYDVGIVLMLNAPTTVAGGFPTIAPVAAGASGLAADANVTLVGFGGGNGPTVPPLMGTMTMKNPATDAGANTYTFYTPPSANMIQPGDSGGPEVLQGTNTIVSVSSASNVPSNGKPLPPSPNSTTARIDSNPDNSFVLGNGDSVSGMGWVNTLNPNVAGTAVNWTTAAVWQRGSGAAQTVPQANDAVLLDPTTGSDVATTVTLDANSAALIGLATDVTLQVSGTALNVLGNGGILNGGIIKVSGTTASAVTSAWKLDDIGTINVGVNGNLTVGTSIVPTNGTVGGLANVDSVYIGSLTATPGVINVTGGGTFQNLNAANQNAELWVDTTGLLNVTGTASSASTNYCYNGGSITASGGSFFSVSNTSGVKTSYLINAGTITASNGSTITSAALQGNTSYDVVNLAGGIINVLGNTANATFQIQSPLANGYYVGAISNSGAINVSGMGNTLGTFQATQLNNTGTTTIGQNGQWLFGNYIYNQNFGQITVNGGSANFGYVQNGNILAPGANPTITVTSFGTMNSMNPAANANARSFDNGGTVNVTSGGTLNVTYNGAAGTGGTALYNAGTLNVKGMNLLLPGGTNVKVNNGDLVNTGTLTLGFGGQVLFSNADLTNTGAINGEGTLRFTGESSNDNQASIPATAGYDTNLVSYVFDGDSGSMEAPSTNVGAKLAAFSDPSAIFDLSIINSSVVSLADLYSNSGGAAPEAIYTEYLGVDATSTLNLGTINVYYEFLDPSEGNLTGIVTTSGGLLIQVPEPTSGVLLLLAGLAATRRSRRVIPHANRFGAATRASIRE
jgi:hypothetical protein